MRITEEINRAVNGGHIKLRSGEYEGPAVINKPLMVEGDRSTIWCLEGPVIETRAPNIILKNLQVEVTGTASIREKRIAIRVNGNSKPTFINVEVRGLVDGIPGESGEWSYPDTLNLCNLAPGRNYKFIIKVLVPVPCKIVSKVAGIYFSTDLLKPGLNEITVYVGSLAQDSIICSDFLLLSSFIRRVPVYGRVLPANTNEIPTAIDGAVIWDATNNPTEKETYNSNPTDRSLVATAKRLEVKPADIVRNNLLQKGQRIDLTKKTTTMKETIIGFGWDISEHTDWPHEIDCSVFLLDQCNKVAMDDDFIFYGNLGHDNDYIILLDKILLNDGITSDKKQILVDLSLIPEKIKKIAFTLTIFEHKKRRQCFDQLRNLYVRLVDQTKKTEMLRFYLDDLSNETAVVAIELYRHKGFWKVAATGAGFFGGLKALCEDFGVEVEG